ncbi:MAG: carboxypeptidase-like regulatory domain-containing protein [Bacteroidota bacterium]
MKKLIVLCWIPLCLLLFTTCKKDNTFKVSLQGTIFDPNSNQPVSNANIVLSASMISSGTYNSNYNEVTSTSSDANGNYSISTSITGKPVGFRIAVVKQGYFFNSVDIGPTVFDNNTTYQQSFNIYPEAYLALQVKNVSPNDSTDKITYYYTTLPSLFCSQCCSDNQITGNGQYYQSASTCKTYGNQWTKIIWTVIKFGNLNYHVDSIFCNSFDTAHYSINY